MTWNIAHRGGAALVPENTLAAFRDAVARGCDGAELDVQLSADGEVVVCHDFRLKPELCRNEDGLWLAEAGPPVKELTLAALKRYDIGRADPASLYARVHPHVAWQDGERIPTLGEVVEAVRGRPFTLFVELKSSYDELALSAAPEALAEAAVAELRKAGHLAQSVFVGFDWRALLIARKLAPEVPCWFTTDAGRVTDNTLPRIRDLGGQGWFPHFSDATPERVAQARSLGLKVGAWTVNEAADMAALTKRGLDALCTDRPDILAGIAGSHTGPLAT